MSIEKKLLGTSPSGGDAPNVEDVFSTYLYEGTGSTRTITNGIDLAGEGGMTWVKRRTNGSYHHQILDTERSASGGFNALSSNTTGAENYVYGFAFNSDGYTLNGGQSTMNVSGEDYASWTFRKAPRFFDVVTYTGDGVTGREIAHDLGCDVGMIFIKLRHELSGNTGSWRTYHKSLGGTQYLLLEDTAAASTWSGIFNDTDATDSVFTVTGHTHVNALGGEYVAYLFAHDPDGENDDGMIACGSFTMATTSSTPEIDLGWEPQYVLTKRSGGTGGWKMVDSMRGFHSDYTNASKILYPNTSGAEVNSGSHKVLANGFSYTSDDTGDYIYMAIRAPMMKEPESGSEVFNLAGGNTSGTLISAGFPTDFMISKGEGSGTWPVASTRLTNGDGKTYLRTDSTAAEAVTGGTDKHFEHDLGNYFRQDWGNNPSITYMFKRAKGWFDVVAYTGTGSAHTEKHSLGVVPEMMIVKNRTDAYPWNVWTTGFLIGSANNEYLQLNTSGAKADKGAPEFWGSSYPTSSVFNIGTSSYVNRSASNYIAYLFATLAGVSKVGSFTGNGSSQNIACGFSAGARFVLIKRTDSTGDWYIWDTTRGIVTGNDPHLSLNTTSAEVTSDDSIDPESAGFTVNQVSATNINVSSASYIFLAIA